MEHTKKALSPRIGEEVWLPLDYINIRCKATKEALTSQPFSGNDFVTLKPIHERNVPKELQLHARFKDKETGKTWDVDIYLLLGKAILLEKQMPEWKRLVRSIKESNVVRVYTFRKRKRKHQ